MSSQAPWHYDIYPDGSIIHYHEWLDGKCWLCGATKREKRQ